MLGDHPEHLILYRLLNTPMEVCNTSYGALIDVCVYAGGVFPAVFFRPGGDGDELEVGRKPRRKPVVTSGGGLLAVAPCKLKTRSTMFRPLCCTSLALTNPAMRPVRFLLGESDYGSVEPNDSPRRQVGSVRAVHVASRARAPMNCLPAGDEAI